jgi:hypothetical protein
MPRRGGVGRFTFDLRGACAERAVQQREADVVDFLLPAREWCRAPGRARGEGGRDVGVAVGEVELGGVGAGPRGFVHPAWFVLRASLLLRLAGGE